MIGYNYFYNASLLLLFTIKEMLDIIVSVAIILTIYLSRVYVYTSDGISARRFIKYPLVMRAFVVARIITARYIEERDDRALR